MDWHEVAVTVSTEGEEAVADLFYQLGCPGVRIENPELLQSYIESGIWDYHAFGEIALTGQSVVTGYFAEEQSLKTKLSRLESGVKELLQHFPNWVVQVKGATVREEDWATAWKAYFKPIPIGRFLIKPTWEEAVASDHQLVLELDPGMAFGTGTHATTTLCLRALEDRLKPGMEMFDLGTGSGILAIAGAKLGARVKAVDLDPVAVQVARENVDLNRIAGDVEVLEGNLGTVLHGDADLVVANIIADVILELLPDLKKLLRPQGVFLASGIIDKRAFDVEEGLLQAGLETVERREESGWVLLIARWATLASV